MLSSLFILRHHISMEEVLLHIVHTRHCKEHKEQNCKTAPHVIARREMNESVTYTRHCEERSDVAISLHIITLPYISRSTQSNRTMYFVIAKHCKFPKYLSRSTRNHTNIYFVRVNVRRPTNPRRKNGSFLCEVYGNALKTVFFARKSASSQKNRTISLRGWLK